MDFFVESWYDDAFSPIFGEKVVFVTNREHCFSFQGIDGKTVRIQENYLTNYFEEADNRMFFHVNSIPTPSNVVIRVRDCDILIIALGIFDIFKEDLNLWLEIGLFSNNTLEYISINQLFDVLGKKLCQSLPAFHVFTGSDYTAAFCGKGKIKPLRKLEKSEEFQYAFASLGSSEIIEESVVKAIEKFVCQIYMKPKLNSVDEVRLELFAGKYKITPGTPLSLSSLKNMDSSSWSPCSVELYEKILRTNLISNRMHLSHLPSHSNIPPVTNGWYRQGQYYYIKWFKGDATPSNLDAFSTPYNDESECDSECVFGGNFSSDSESNDEM